ncbi:MAG: hypothetical protein JNJ83_21955 [Verrucomicrobiaceae bacterium]|nr:hypothetical protein [Verrucomicrobiaceae bacterium]
MATNLINNSRWLLATGFLAAATLNSTVNAGAPTSAKNPPAAPESAVDWKTNTISPVSNPIFFEDPVIRTELRPIFA